MGGAINNEGTISANLGKVGIGVGQEIILDLSGDKFLQVAVPIDEATTVFDENEEENENEKKALLGASWVDCGSFWEASWNEKTSKFIGGASMS